MAKQRLRPNFPKGMGGRIMVPQSVLNTEEGIRRAAIETIIVPMGWQLVVEHFIAMLRDGKELPEGQELETFFAKCLDTANKWNQVSNAWKMDLLKDMASESELEGVPDKTRKVIVD